MATVRPFVLPCLAAVLFGCRDDLSAHWSGEPCGPYSGYEMAFDVVVVEKKVGKDRIWGGNGTIVHPCLGQASEVGWEVMDGTIACEWTYDVAMKHHDERGFTGWIFSSFTNCRIPDFPAVKYAECPFGLAMASQRGDGLDTTLYMGHPLGYRECPVTLTRE